MGISFSDFSGTGPRLNEFDLVIGISGHTTFQLDSPKPAGTYAVTSQLNDSSFDIYLITDSYEHAGYTNSNSLTATAKFNKVVVYGATPNDVLTFSYKLASVPGTSGDVLDGAAPFLTSAIPTTLESIDDTTTVTGGNFASDVEISFVGSDDVARPAKNIVRSSSTSLIVTRPDDLPVEYEPYSMIATNSGIVNPSLNVHKLENYFDAGSGVVWITASPLTGGLAGYSYLATLTATDADGAGIVYTISSGSLPSGLSLDGSTGIISGTPDTVETQVFTVTATDSGNNSSQREFSIQIAAPTAATDFLVIAGGGGATLGGGGAGGYREFSSIDFPIGLPISVSIGAGGSVGTYTYQVYASSGTNSVFGDYSATGGGAGGAGSGYPSGPTNVGLPGGSGGGASQYYGSGGAGNAGGYTPVEGYKGGDTVSHLQAYGSAGGGGAGGAGVNGSGGAAGGGGIGRASSITGTSVYRAGGGAGAVRENYPKGTGGLGGGGNVNSPGEINTGGGGGGMEGDGNEGTGNGGSGVVIVKYPAELSILSGPGLVSSTDSSSVPGYKVTTFESGTDTISFAFA